jgi:ParB-like chromosome segregation protein Spo0J
MKGPAFDELVADIGEHGLREPIVLHPDGSILDGRNRYAACQLAGVEPRTVLWTGAPGTEVAFVLSANLHRRHLSESQRAMVAAKIARLDQGQRQSRQLADVPTQAQAATALNVGARSAQRAKVVLDGGDAELIAAVERGEFAVSRAAAQVQKRAPQRRAPKPETALTRFAGALKTLAKLPPATEVVAAATTPKARALLAEKIADAEAALAAVKAELLLHDAAFASLDTSRPT